MHTHTLRMSSICSSLRGFLPQWRHTNSRFLIFLPSQRMVCFVSASLNDDLPPIPKQNQMSYDPSENLFGLEAELKPRNAIVGVAKPRSWFGPNGQYIRELPCPSCRGRGYTPCAKCGIERSRSDCLLCNGKGIKSCSQCSGDCVIWEEYIDERPWEKARSVSPLKVKEDVDVDNLDIKPNKRRKSKRKYQSTPPEVGLKISRSLKSLNARTGLFSKRMKLIHGDPVLHAQRVAAIKKAKGTTAARKRTSETLISFFRDPENRRKRSVSMKGVKFHCKNCGGEGHRSHYCSDQNSSFDRRFTCRVCGQKGHNRRTCRNSISTESENIAVMHRHSCKVCGLNGHNRRTCPNLDSHVVAFKVRVYACSLCRKNGHNCRTCPTKNGND